VEKIVDPTGTRNSDPSRNNIWLQVRIMKILIMDFFQAPVATRVLGSNLRINMFS
jgi:hypothetical protein